MMKKLITYIIIIVTVTNFPQHGFALRPMAGAITARPFYEITVDETSYELYGRRKPRKRYLEIGKGFVDELAAIAPVKELTFSASRAGEFVVISGSEIEGWGKVELKLAINNPNGSRIIYDMSVFKGIFLKIPSSYLSEKRIQKFLLEMVHEGITSIDLSDCSAYLSPGNIVTLFKDSLAFMRGVKAENPEILGSFKLTWVEEEKTIIVPSASPLHRSGSVLHPLFFLWPKQGVGVCAQVSGANIRFISPEESIFTKDQDQLPSAKLVPFSVPLAEGYTELNAVRKSLGLQTLVEVEEGLRERFRSVVSEKVEDTRPEDLNIVSSFNCTDQNLEYAKRQIVSWIESEGRRFFKRFSIDIIVLATVKGEDEKELFIIDGVKTPFICWEEGVLVVNNPTFSGIHFQDITDTMGSLISFDALGDLVVLAVLKGKRLSAKKDPVANLGPKPAGLIQGRDFIELLINAAA